MSFPGLKSININLLLGYDSWKLKGLNNSLMPIVHIHIQAYYFLMFSVFEILDQESIWTM